MAGGGKIVAVLENHTLVIPTRDRPELLGRLAGYLRERAPSLKLLVLDSSAAGTARQNAEVLAGHGPLLRHAVFPPEEPLVSRFGRGLGLVDTPCVSFCADDDVVFTDALGRAADFLDTRPEYVCAHGLYLNFRASGRELHVSREYSGPDNEASHPGARIFRLLQKYESLFYAVFRTRDLRQIFAALPAVPTYHYQELFQSVAAVIKGRVKRFPEIYAARRSGPAAEPGREKWQTFTWFGDNPAEVLESYAVYRQEAWKFYDACAAAPRLERGQFLRVLDISHAVYFATGCRPEAFHSALQAYWPEDSYLEVARVNFFARPPLPQLLGGSDLSRLLTGAGYAIGVVCAVPYLAWLNLRIARACRVPWKCVPALSQRWLAMNPEFRRGCLELCRYMDQA